MTDKVEAFFAHYGVPGMRWGRRGGKSSTPVARIKNQNTGKQADIKLTRKQSRQLDRGSQTPPKHNNTLSSRPKNRKMSDAELRAKVNRLQMEKQLKDLTATPAKPEHFVKTLLKDSGKQAARSLAQTATKVAIQMALEKAAGGAKAGSGSKAFLDAMAASGAKKKKG